MFVGDDEYVPCVVGVEVQHDVAVLKPLDDKVHGVFILVCLHAEYADIFIAVVCF